MVKGLEILEKLRIEMMTDSKDEVNIRLFFQVLNVVLIAVFLVITLHLIHQPEKDYVKITGFLITVVLLLIGTLRNSYIIRDAVKIFELGETTKPILDEARKQNPE